MEALQVRPSPALVPSWLRALRIAVVVPYRTPLIDRLLSGIREHLFREGQIVQDEPTSDTDVIITTAPYDQPVSWRRAPLFVASHRYRMRRTPSVYTLVHARPAEFASRLAHLDDALGTNPPQPELFAFKGLAPQAHEVIIEQGRRGGPILALERVVQAQTKSLRVIMAVGEEQPDRVYHFDLVGAHPRSEGRGDALYADIALRIIAAESTRTVNAHETATPLISRPMWDALHTPDQMCAAMDQLGARSFFTSMVRICDLIHVPALHGAIASQYSEGCCGTWDPGLDALIATVTGSARPVRKDRLTHDDLAVIVGVRPDGRGARVRPVDGLANDPPSSEAVEMYDMDAVLPTVRLGPEWPTPGTVPVVRSKLHGHRGVASYDPSRVEYVALDAVYAHYLVTCGSDIQAVGIKRAFERSEALQNPADPRAVAFTVLPGHGIVIAEKWVPGKAPFQVMWEYMDAGYLCVESTVPQGSLTYDTGTADRATLVDLAHRS